MLLILASTSAVCRGAEVVEVGEYGETARLSFEGLRTFDEANLKRSLRSNLDYQLARHPSAPLTEFLATLEKMLRTGFRHAGFPEAQVQPRLDREAGRVVVKLVEGPRYDCGVIKVTGLKRIEVGSFSQRLTRALTETNRQQSAESLQLCWLPETPAPFDQVSRRALAGMVTNVFADLGCFFPKFQVRIAPQPGQRLAELQVEVADEGPPGVLSKIEVTGTECNRSQEVISFLKLAPGLHVNRELLAQKEKLLRDSARFLRYELTPVPLDDTGRLWLKIALSDCAQARPLRQELTREERLLVKFCDWLSSWPKRDEDWVVDVTIGLADGGHYALKWVTSPHDGVLLALHQAKPGGQRPLVAAAIVSPSTAAFFSSGAQQKLMTPKFQGRLQIFARVQPNTGPDTTNQWTLQMGGGVDTQEAAPPVQVDTQLPPAAFVSLARSGWRWEGTQLTLVSTNWELRLDGQSGRLLRLASREIPAAQPKGLSGRVEMTFAPGAFSQVSNEIVQTCLAYTNVYDPQRPLSSSVLFGAQYLLRLPPFATVLPPKVSPAQTALAGQAARKVLSEAALAPLKAVLTNCDRLWLFDDAAETPPASLASSALGGILLSWAEDVLPPGSWPWTLVREGALALNGRGRYTQAELGRLYLSPQAGPIGYLAIARLLGNMDMEAGRNFATRGLQRLSAEDFRQDWRLLFEGNAALSQCLSNVAVNLSRLNEKEVEALAAFLPGSADILLRQSARALRQSAGQPAAAVLAPAFEGYWNRTLKSRVEAALSEVVSPGSSLHQPPPAASPQKAAPAAAPTTNALLEAAQQDFAAGRYAEAEKKYRQLLDSGASNPKLFGDLATIQLRANHLSDAEETLRRALVLHPDDAYCLTLQGRLKMSQHNWDGALADLSRAADLDPNDAQTQNFLGAVLSQKGQRVAAEAAFRAAIRLNPKYADAHYNLAICYASKQPPEKGLGRFHYQKAVELGHAKSAELERMLGTESP